MRISLTRLVSAGNHLLIGSRVDREVDKAHQIRHLLIQKIWAQGLSHRHGRSWSRSKSESGRAVNLFLQGRFYGKPPLTRKHITRNVSERVTMILLQLLQRRRPDSLFRRQSLQQQLGPNL
jgi:hypothetical protein